MIAPFSERISFWDTLLNLAPRDKLYGVLDVDRDILPMFGYKVSEIRQVMSCVADDIDHTPPSGFSYRAFDVETDAEIVGNVLYNSYLGGVDYELRKSPTIKAAVDDVIQISKAYTKSMSQVVIDEQSGEIIGVVLAGTSETFTNKMMIEIGEVGVLPQFRGKGLAKCMINRVIAQSYD